MHINTDTRFAARYLGGLILGICLIVPRPGLGAALTLATSPLANSTTTTVLPNLMFILDDSGSMDYDYLPDWAGNTPANASSSQYSTLKSNAAFNGVYYNPAIRYDPPVLYNSDGTLNTTTYLSQIGASTVTGASSASKPNWRAVKNDAYGVQSNSTSNLEGSASFYTFVPGEYCTLPDLKTCVTQSAPDANYPYSGALRWCSNTALTNCQRVNTSTYQYVRYAGMPSTATISIKSISGTNTFSSIKVNAKEILSSNVSYNGNTEANLGDAIASAINNCTSAITGSCQIAGYSAVRQGTGNNTVVVISAPSSLGIITYTPSMTRSGTGTFSVSAFSGGTPGQNILTNIVSTTTSYPYPGTAVKAASRTDCAGSTCTYAEEMTNYANWWTYYHTRMQSMKTSVSRAFKGVDNRFRVGYTTISYTGATDGAEYQHIDKFELAQKNTWFTKLFGADPSGSTPLRSALAKVGRIYGHKLGSGADPVQYSCQQNFTILSTDGYWNTGSEYGYPSLTGGNIGDVDGGSTPRPMYEGPTAVSNSLADIAKYYYDTDLRTSTLGNCTGALGGSIDVCDNNVFVSSTDNNTQQHMTTFTIGLGVDGVLDYSGDYTTIKKDTATNTYPAPTNGSMDYYNLINGYGSPTVNWPNPQTSSNGNSVVERIDDLWHAAVNGHGIYFSARDPDAIYAGFQTALAAIQSRVGAGAAAATSTLNPVAGDNQAFVASYTTVKWIGNLEARSIDTTTGAVSQSAIWCAEDVTASALGATACSGTMAGKVGPSSDSRTIYMKSGANLQSFNYTNLGTAGLSSYFDSGYLSSHLSQWGSLTSPQQTLAAGANLVNYLRGQYGYDNRSTNTDRLYRFREAVLGDATESKPAFVGKPTFSYVDPGYSAFVTAKTSRSGVVYLGANDGMMHAFDVSNGNELWAYVPTMVIPNLWKLADENYSVQHANYVNGSAVISDICSANCTDAATAVWKTILVGGLNGGGRGYFALDITDPASPALLWEFSASNDSDLGYSFGNPVITKKADGTWVVLLTSGYDNGTISGDGVTNNAITGNGQGYLYVLNANSGALISKIGTGVGSAATPSGFARIAGWADNSVTNNTATYVYGGDLQGNVWRFDINAPAVVGTNPFKLATLYSDAGGTVAQPITVRPELGNVNGKRVIYVGTGKYLETSDLSTTQLQTLYAILDDDATTTLVNPRTSLAQQTLTTSGAQRTASNNAVDWSTGRGWFVNFPDVGERQNVDGKLESGTLLVPTTVPSDTVCSPGGYGWLNYFDYETGGPVNTDTNLAGDKTNAPIVGINIYYINGKPVVAAVTADDPTPQVHDDVPFKSQSSSFQKKKVIWRELIQ